MRIVIVGAALIVPVALALVGCSGEDSRPDNLDSIVHDGSDAAVAPAPTTGATAVEATEEAVAGATADVPAYLGCEQIHECVLDDFVDIWDGYNGIHSPEDALGRINLYFYPGAISDDGHVEGAKSFEYLDEAERVLPRIERRMGVGFTGDLYIMIYENWNAMKHFAPDPDVELPSLTLGRDTLVINHDHDDIVGTIQSEIGRMVQEALSVDGDPASPQGPADVVAGREEGSEMVEREPGPAPVQPSDDAGSCVAGTPGCFLVIDVDDCLKLRAYPSFEGEALDCVPNGTNLIEKRGYIPLKTDDNVVWRLFETADGQWLGWAEGRFLHGAGRQSPTRVPLVIPLRASTDADVCVPGAVLFLDEPEPNSAPAALHCLAVVDADYCLKLRTYPSFEGEVLDCVPDGTKLFTQGRSFKREDNVAWYPVGAADGQWLGWAEGRFLQGTRPSGRQPLTITLRTSTDVDACIPGDLLSFEGPELNLPYGTFFCLAVVGADDCLEVRETPGPDGRKLDCVPDGTRFIVAAEFYDIAAEDTDGVVWRLVRWGDGRAAGWVNNHHLDGPSPNRMVAVGPPVPAMEFPDDIALIASPYPDAGMGRDGWPQELVRIYQRPGQGLVSETLFSPHNPDLTDVRYTYYFYHHSTAEGPVLGAGVCLADHSDPRGYGGCLEADCCGLHTAHYESRDGGVTWERLAIPEGPWYLISFLPGDAEHPATRMLLLHILNGDFMMFPSGEIVEQPPGQHNGLRPELLADGRIAWPVGEWEWNESTRRSEGMSITADGEDVSALAAENRWSPWEYIVDLPISDRLYFQPYDYYESTTYEIGDLLGEAAQGAYKPYVYLGEFLPDRGLYWPTIQNVETGEEWPVVFPADVLRLGDSFIPRLVLRGPFLRVVDVGDCLPLRAKPSPDAEELACAAERVLLQDQGDVVTDEGVTWNRVRTPAGIEGWADGQFLE